MKDGDTSSGKGRIMEGGGEQASTNVALGDMIYIRLHRDSWWPAQVVDENTVSENVKPGKGSAGEVLVRLYGSYKYLYVDPTKSRSEFEKILKQNNGSYREILEKSLEKVLPSSKPRGSKNSGGSKTKGLAKKKSKRLKPSSSTQNTENSPVPIEVLNDDDPSTRNPEAASSQEPSDRRMRVMNKLGLTPPPGSPFNKN